MIWFCWGQRHVHQAIESARTATALGLDRFLITNEAGRAQAETSAEFLSVIVTGLAYTNNLEKSRLIDLLPEGYDTFVFLDSDTRVLGDLALGFEKAERHGIAMVPAPNYNLGEFFGFGEIMRKVGVRPADQLMFNSGVIFFHLSAVVRAVLKRWRDLCRTVGVHAAYVRDQPFLTLAFEQLEFVPYVLSPLYNYRAMGEYAVGGIRIWHSHHPPPIDLNVFRHAWPARRFNDSIEAPGSSPALSEQRPPQAMLRLELAAALPVLRSQPLGNPSVASTAAANRTNRQRNEDLLKKIGMGASSERDEQYYAEALHYHRGLVHAYLHEPEQMAEHVSLSHTMPTSESDLLFSDHVNLSHVMRAQQERGIRRKLPPILIACMPRAATATIAHTLARFLNIPVFRLSIGQFPDYFLAPSWLDMFLEGGGLTQDHFGPSDFNIGVLAGRGRRHVFVVARDPRAAARSQVHYRLGGEANFAASLETRIEEVCTGQFIPWLQGWIDLANRADLPFEIHWITYRQISQDPAGVLRAICRILAAEFDAVSAFVDCRHVSEVRIHYVTGDDNAWRSEVRADVRERLWLACTPAIRSLLDLQP